MTFSNWDIYALPLCVLAVAKQSHDIVRSRTALVGRDSVRESAPDDRPDGAYAFSPAATRRRATAFGGRGAARSRLCGRRGTHGTGTGGPARKLRLCRRRRAPLDQEHAHRPLALDRNLAAILADKLRRQQRAGG